MIPVPAGAHVLPRVGHLSPGDGSAYGARATKFPNGPAQIRVRLSPLAVAKILELTDGGPVRACAPVASCRR